MINSGKVYKHIRDEWPIKLQYFVPERWADQNRSLVKDGVKVLSRLRQSLSDDGMEWYIDILGKMANVEGPIVVHRYTISFPEKVYKIACPTYNMEFYDDDIKLDESGQYIYLYNDELDVIREYCNYLSGIVGGDS